MVTRVGWGGTQKGVEHDTNGQHEESCSDVLYFDCIDINILVMILFTPYTQATCVPLRETG